MSDLTTYVDVIPVCDLCKEPAEYDARMKNTLAWAYLCRDHMIEHGAGLGLGQGQLLLLRSNNER